MPHCDPDILALRAIGETVPVDDEAHLAACPSCQSTLDQLRGVVATARAVDEDDAPVPPRSRVWSAIADELQLADRTTPRPAEPLGQHTRPIVDTSATPIRRGGGRRVRPRTLWLGIAAAFVGLLVGVTSSALLHRSDNQRGTVLASTVLEPVDAGNAHGTATLHLTADGRQLEVDLRDLPRTTGYFEVWFMNASTGGAVSLGSLNADKPTTFDVPKGLQLNDFPYIDVSVEPIDGNPAHSNDSIARGRLAP